MVGHKGDYFAGWDHIFRMSNINKMQVRGNEAHDHRKKTLDRYQKAMRIQFEPQGKDEEPLKIKENWCPVPQRWSSAPKERVAAHIIPHFMTILWALRTSPGCLETRAITQLAGATYGALKMA